MYSTTVRTNEESDDIHQSIFCNFHTLSSCGVCGDPALHLDQFHHLLPALQSFGRCWKLIKRQSKWIKGTSYSSIILVVSIMLGNGKQNPVNPSNSTLPRSLNVSVGIFALHEKLHGGEGMCGSKGLSFKHVLYSKPTSCWILVTRVCHNHLKQP